MNITSLMPKFNKSDDYEPTAAEIAADEREAKALAHKNRPKTGPKRVRFVSNGQQRRFVKRSKASSQRKANVRHRKAWMDNERRVAALRGQLETVAAIKTPRGLYLTGQSPQSMRIVHEHLTNVYGSVDKAAERYVEILAERA